MLVQSLDTILKVDRPALSNRTARDLTADDETTSVLRALDHALVDEDRAEILAQYDRAILLLTSKKCWQSGQQVAQRVYDAVQCWQDRDCAPYARVLAQFDYNYALELQRAHRAEAAQELLREACELFEGCGDAAGTIQSQHQLGRMLLARGELSAAESCYVSSLQRAQALKDVKYMCRNLFQLGELAQIQGDWGSSLDWFSQAQNLAEEMRDDLTAIAAMHQQGTVEHMRGDDAAAAEHFRAALACSEKIGSARGAANALHQLGMLSQARGEISQAEELYRASLTHAANLPDRAEQAPTLYQLAQCAWTHGDFVAAKGYSERSLSLVKARGNPVEIARIWRLQRSIRDLLPN